MNKNCCIFVAFLLKRATLDKIRGRTKVGGWDFFKKKLEFTLEKITFLLKERKNSGEVRISDSLLLSLHNERTKLRVSAVDPK